MHWGEKHRYADAWKDEVYWRLRGRYPQLTIIERAILTVTICTTRPQDFDNAVASLKPVIDGLKGFAIRDDDATHCEMRFKVEKVIHKAQEKIKIKIEPQP